MKEEALDPLVEFRSVNVEGTLRLARQAAEAGVRRFIFISSIGVNGGDTFAHPFAAEDNVAPHTPYAISKHEAEVGLRALADNTKMEIVIIRPPLVYGPNAPGNFLSLMNWLMSGIPLPLGAVIENRRSFVFIDNLVDLIVTCLDHPAAANQTFLVSDGESLSTAALLRRMGEALGRPARLIQVPVPLLQMGAALLGKRDMAQRLCGSLEVDIGKTRELLGWTPPISVDEGLRRTAAHWLATAGAGK
jgi:nucleoside-diphosphate-sugar epimerase